MFSVYLGTGGTHILSGAWYNREIVVLRRYLTLELGHTSFFTDKRVPNLTVLRASLSVKMLSP